MRLLLDANLSPKLTAELGDAGFEAIHVADLDLLHATDEEIFDWAAAHGSVIVTADSDFARLLVFRRVSSPSVLQLRGVAELPRQVHRELLVANLPAVAADLASGAIVSLSPTRLAVRTLPVR